MTLLTLEEVTKSFHLPDGRKLTILSGINLSVNAGDRISIVGRSGSGKSTLLNMLGLLDDPSSGELRFHDLPLSKISNAKRDRMRGAEIGFVFQQFNLLEGRTALENVTMPLIYAKGKQFWRRKQLAAEMLERVGLGHRLNNMPDRLSGGEQQRVAIARSLVRGPQLILADEPTGALDIETGNSVMGLIDEVATHTGAALVTITHDPAIAALGREHYSLKDGRLHRKTLVHEPEFAGVSEVAAVEHPESIEGEQ